MTGKCRGTSRKETGVHQVNTDIYTSRKSFNMQKTPSVFLRNPENMAELTQEVNPLAQWVIDGEGVATRKYDGTCVMLDENGKWWARREVKKDKTPPPNWLALDADPITGKRMGWEPYEQSGIRKHLEDALGHFNNDVRLPPEPIQSGTYELCGPKINGNPENYDHHVLIRHAEAMLLPVSDRSRKELRTFEDFKLFLEFVDREFKWEGLVWHHPDGRMAKLKVSDFK